MTDPRREQINAMLDYWQQVLPQVTNPPISQGLAPRTLVLKCLVVQVVNMARQNGLGADEIRGDVEVGLRAADSALQRLAGRRIN